MATRSMMPSKALSRPMGSCMRTALRPSFSTSWSRTLTGLAPTRSTLLTKAMKGTLYRRSWRSTVIVWDWTPPTEQRTRMAESRTRRERSTSMVKSTWPGVSMMLTEWPSQPTLVVAEAMVMPRSRSRSMESMVAPTPSLPLTSWILWIFLQ